MASWAAFGRYGRFQEAFSEDPHLTSVMGAAHLKGLQGGAMGGPETYLNNFTHALVGTVKHYAAYGMGAGGIDGSPADVSEQKLREVYLAPWKYEKKEKAADPQTSILYPTYILYLCD